MSEPHRYTPITKHVRTQYALGNRKLTHDEEESRLEAFDRWLAGEKAEALRDAADDLGNWLLARAALIAARDARLGADR